MGKGQDFTFQDGTGFPDFSTTIPYQDQLNPKHYPDKTSFLSKSAHECSFSNSHQGNSKRK